MRPPYTPPTSFWIIAVMAIVWNFVEFYFSSYEIDLIQQNATVEEFERIQSLSIWFIAIFLLGLFAELLGSFALFMRRKIAIPLYGAAVFALVLVEIYWLAVIDIEMTSTFLSIVVPLMVIAVAVFLLMYSSYAAKKSWIK
ncbi:MAG: hypothetical protein WBG46_00355 [Nonlabens sp.]